MIQWLSKHKFQAHLTAFLLMIVSSIGMLIQLQGQGGALIWLLVAIFGLANMLAIFIK
jgi:hypothetical protein